MHETWVGDKDFRIYDIKKAKNSRSQYFNYSNYLCTACNTAIEKFLKVDFEKKKKN